MANYVFAYHGGRSPESEEEGAAVMKAWMDWFADLGEAVVDVGAPTGESATLAADGSSSPGGGTNPVTGYSIVAADSLESALAIAKGCPQLAAGGTIEVAEALSVM